ASRMAARLLPLPEISTTMGSVIARELLLWSVRALGHERGALARLRRLRGHLDRRRHARGPRCGLGRGRSRRSRLAHDRELQHHVALALEAQELLLVLMPRRAGDDAVLVALGHSLIEWVGDGHAVDRQRRVRG